MTLKRFFGGGTQLHKPCQVEIKPHLLNCPLALASELAMPKGPPALHLRGELQKSATIKK